MPTATPALPELRHAFVAPIDGFEVRAGGRPDEVVIRGHAAVFDRTSHDLGGFRERIARGAFSSVLDTNPDVHLVVGHDMNQPLARTRAGSLELREDPLGLHIWARVALATTYARDAVEAMRLGLLDQASFAFRVADGGDSWEKTDGQIIRTITAVGGLFDVSVVAQGAYPQTDMAVTRSLLAAAEAAGRLAQRGANPDVAPIAVGVAPDVAPLAVGADPDVAPEVGVDNGTHLMRAYRARAARHLHLVQNQE